MKLHSVFRRLAALAVTAALAAGLTVSAAAAGFTDVPQSHWAAQSIARCAELGVLRGESAASFGQGKPMTRAAFVTALCRLLSWDAGASTDTPYEDVSPDAWYAGAVSAAVRGGALTAQADCFRPDEAITREELAVMLVRALGYTTISGLTADHPFTDVDTNAGYITMAYDLGLMTGTSAAAFSPDAPATREQAAVILMRLADKLRADAPNLTALVTQWPRQGADLQGFSAVAVAAARLTASGQKAVLSKTMSEKDIAAAKDAAGNVPVLLHVTAGETVLSKTDPTAAASLLASAVEIGGWDGIFLEVEDGAATSNLTALAAAVDAAMGDRPFTLSVEGPSLSGGGTGLDYGALSAAADELVARVACPVVPASGFTAAPAEPLEELYLCLRTLRDIPNLTVTLSARPTAWRGTAALSAPEGSDIESYLAQGAQRYYSKRYGCPYLRLNDGPTIWYHDSESAAARLQLLGLFGRGSICLTGAQTATADLLAGLELR